jgi:hypothetical protein
MAIHRCPHCGLWFMSGSGVEWHLLKNHGSRMLDRLACGNAGTIFPRSPPVMPAGSTRSGTSQAYFRTRHNEWAAT